MPDFSSFEELLAHHTCPFTLREDQKADLEELFPFKRVGLFCEVGTGKTALATYLAIAWDADHNIVFMPPILLRQWEKWLLSVREAGDVLVYKGTPKKRAELRTKMLQHKWVLMTPGIFKNDYVELGKLFMGRTLTGIVDEGHSVKNVSSDTHKKVRDFFIASHLQILTGTPLSAPGDVYAYTKLKTPGIYRSQKQFEDIHVEERDFFDNIVKWRNIELLKTNLMLQSVRRLSAEVLKIAQPNYIPIVYELEKEHAELYRVLAEEQLLKLPDGGKIDATSAGRLYNALQQIVVNWDYFSGDPDCKSNALNLIDVVCDEIDVGNKALDEQGLPLYSKLIIFTYYKMTSAAALRYVQENLKLDAVACYSDVTQTKQAANIDRFINDPDCRVLVAQPTSAGYGLNPQGVCWEELWLEEPIVPKDFVQGVGRVARDGQLHVPNVRLAIAEGTIQHRLHHRLLDKDAIVNAVQGGYQDLRDAIYGR
jgi:SNF2 family DNA or RNA helicase